MPRMELDALLQHLLDSGVAPRYVCRLAVELDEHRVDLEEEALAACAMPDEAVAEAQARLGSYGAIATEFARHRELMSWVYTSTWLVAALRMLARAAIASSRSLTAAGDGCRALARYAGATAAAASLTLGLLWTMQWAIGAGPPRHGERRAREVQPWELLALSAPAAPTGTTAPSRPRAPAEPVTALDAITLPERPRHLKGRPRPPSPRPPSRLASAPETWTPSLPGTAFAAVSPVSFRPQIGRPDTDIVPIVRVRPVYPAVAAQRGIEGYVVLEYTVTRTGTVKEVAVVESSNSVFNRAAREAANKFRFKPRVVDGRPVDVRGVRTRIRFELEA